MKVIEISDNYVINLCVHASRKIKETRESLFNKHYEKELQEWKKVFGFNLRSRPSKQMVLSHLQSQGKNPFNMFIETEKIIDKLLVIGCRKRGNVRISMHDYCTLIRWQ